MRVFTWFIVNLTRGHTLIFIFSFIFALTWNLYRQQMSLSAAMTYKYKVNKVTRLEHNWFSCQRCGDDDDVIWRNINPHLLSWGSNFGGLKSKYLNPESSSSVLTNCNTKCLDWHFFLCWPLFLVGVFDLYSKQSQFVFEFYSRCFTRISELMYLIF